MPQHGVTLGVDLYEIWNAGHDLLPTAADQLHLAWDTTPATFAFTMSRSGGIGVGTDGPADALNAVLDDLNTALLTSESNLRDTGAALVWLAGEYAKTDDKAATELHRKQKALG